jgi:uncharacterized protein (DUF1501 family)
MQSRRKFIKIGAASFGSLALRNFGLMPAMAQTAASNSNYQALVCVFLYGGNDSNNMIIPASQYTAYQRIRGTSNLALPTSALKLVTDKISNGYYFHGMMPQLADLFTTGNLAVAANVGPLKALTRKSNLTNLPSNLFSHADQQLEWQTSDPAELVQPTFGWGGRAAGVIQNLNSSTFPPLMSLAGNDIFGLGPNPQIELNPGGTLNLAGFDYSLKQARSAALDSLLTTDTGLSLYGTANAIMSQSISNAKLLSNALNGVTLTTTFPAAGGNLGQQLKQVALIMKANQTGAGLGMTKQIFFCSLGGFDTHTGELEAHNNLYPQLDSALSTFWAALNEVGLQNNVVLFTESEFSRTMQPTTTDGSDHAWGSHHLVLGGAVKGQKVYNSFPTFELNGPDDFDGRGRWIPTAAVDQYGESLIRWFGITNPTDIATVFPNLGNFDTNNNPNPLTFFS